MALISLVTDPASYEVAQLGRPALVAAYPLVAEVRPLIDLARWRRFTEWLPASGMTVRGVVRSRHLRAVFATETIANVSLGRTLNVPFLVVRTRTDPVPALSAVRAHCLALAEEHGLVGVQVSLCCLPDALRASVFPRSGCTVFLPIVADESSA